MITTRITGPALKVFSVMIENPDSELYGFQLLESTGLKSGTLYPLLARLRDAGLLEGRQEAADPTSEKRPLRTYYRLTGEGQAVARRELSAVRVTRAALRPNWTTA